MELIRPIVEERFAKMEEFGENWDDAPVRQNFSSELVPIHGIGIQNDMLTMLMKEAKGVERSLEGLTRRLIVVNFASIHTTSLVGNTTSLVPYI
jgi:hypothetical protein